MLEIFSSFAFCRLLPSYFRFFKFDGTLSPCEATKKKKNEKIYFLSVYGIHHAYVT